MRPGNRAGKVSHTEVVWNGSSISHWEHCGWRDSGVSVEELGWLCWLQDTQRGVGWYLKWGRGAGGETLT